MGNELWIDKHCPEKAEEIAGNRKAVESIKEFILGFRKGKALLLHGIPGVGKTLSVRLVAKELGYDILEIAASDERGKKALEGFSSATRTHSLFHKGKVILIDEIDGLAAGDRGGASAIAKIIKESSFPVILIANDPWIPKLKPVRAQSSLVKFTKVPAPSVVKFLRGICEKEGLEAEESVLKNLARFCEGDIRTAIIDLQSSSFGGSLTSDGLEGIGYREKSSAILSVLPSLFRSGRIEAGRKLLWEADKDPDEVLWWMENNAHLEFSGENLVQVLELLAKADLFRNLVIKRQQWALKGYMVDLMAGVSVFSKGGQGYVAYRPPDRFLKLARTKQKRSQIKELCTKLGKELHCSTKVVRNDYLPYMKTMLEKWDLGLEEGEKDIILGS